MKVYFTDSDCGCFLFGNESFSFTLSNNHGDCRNNVLVFDSISEYTTYLKSKYSSDHWYNAFQFKTVINGSFNLYKYDCSDMNENDIEAKFIGKYSLHIRNWDYEPPTLAIVKS